MNVTELKRWAVIGLSFFGAGATCAQEAEPDWKSWDWSFGGEASVVMSAGSDPGEGLPDAENLLAEVALQVDGYRVLANGAEIGVRGVVRAQRDHPARPGFAGRFGGAGRGQDGLFSGLSASGAPLDVSSRLSLETAYIYIDGGYGELTLGRDSGVAARFREAPPEVFFLARADGPLLDASGLSVVTTSDRVSGQSVKASYASPRWLGLRAGVSLTPDADAHDGLDRTLAPFDSGLDGAYEIAANLSRRIGREGPRISAGASFSQAGRANGRAAPFAGDVSTGALSLLAEFETVSVGASWLASDDGFSSGEGYEAWSAAVRKDWDAWSGSAAVALSEQRGLDGLSARIGAGRAVGERIDLAVGWRYEELQRTGLGTASSHGPVIEITLRN